MANAASPSFERVVLQQESGRSFSHLGATCAAIHRLNYRIRRLRTTPDITRASRCPVRNRSPKSCLFLVTVVGFGLVNGCSSQTSLKPIELTVQRNRDETGTEVVSVRLPDTIGPSGGILDQGQIMEQFQLQIVGGQTGSISHDFLRSLCDMTDQPDLSTAIAVPMKGRHENSWTFYFAHGGRRKIALHLESISEVRDSRDGNILRTPLYLRSGNAHALEIRFPVEGRKAELIDSYEMELSDKS